MKWAKAWEAAHLAPPAPPAIMKHRVSFIDFADLRRDLQGAADSLEDDMSIQLDRALSSLRTDIDSKRLRPDVAAAHFDHEAARLAKRSADECSALIDKLLAKYCDDRDPEFDKLFSQRERAELHDRYIRACDHRVAAERVRFKSELYSEWTGDAVQSHNPSEDNPKKIHLRLKATPDFCVKDFARLAGVTGNQYKGWHSKSVKKLDTLIRDAANRWLRGERPA